MKELRILKLLDRFAFIFKMLGADYILMRKILEIKLIMDGRRIPTVLNNNKDAEGTKEKNHFLSSLWVYTLMGAITIPFILMGNHYIFQMSLVFGIYLFMIMSTLISDFSSVLLDLRDKNVLLSKPVDAKTVSMAKTVHVLIYMSFISVAFAGIPIVVSLVRHGVLFALLFVCEIILADLFIVAVTALIYLLVLKVFDGEKLKDIINYVQIALAVVIAVGYQLIGRLFQFTELSAVFVPKWWQCFVVPVWFGAPFEILLNASANGYYELFSLLALLVPLISILLFFRLMPVFERSLQKLASYSGSRRKSRLRLSEKIGRLICFSREERTFYRFAIDMMRNEREFKLQVYPSLGLSIVFPFLFIMNEIAYSSSTLPLSPNYCLHLYFGAIFLPSVIQMMKCSANYRAAWIYKTAPVKAVGAIFKGTMKALLVRLFLPVFLVESIIFVLLLGTGIILNLIGIFLNILLFAVLCFHIFEKTLPFSESFGSAQKGAWAAIPTLFILGALAGAHYFLISAWFGAGGIYGVILLSAASNVILWRKVFAMKWEQI
ncbi:MAG: hypothetical protein K0Q48_1585 [Bacillota bacterium]|nr:hypothetical protein [Bacillota bacterium]